MSRSLRNSIGFYDRRYSRPPGPMRDYDRYLDLLPSVVESTGASGATILDVGCGEGHFMQAADRRGYRAHGVEISWQGLQLARKRLDRARLVQAAGEALPFADRAFHVVACLGTLEHFADPDAGVREVSRVLRPDGSALIVVPNRRFIGWRLLGRAGTEQQEVGELVLDRSAWIRLLQANGLRVRTCVAEPWHTKPQPTRLRRWFLRHAWHLIPMRWTYQFAFLCAPQRPEGHQ